MDATTTVPDRLRKLHFEDSPIGYRNFSGWPDLSAAASGESKIRKPGLVVASIDEPGLRTSASSFK
jgi:hypothetical protein